MLIYLVILLLLLLALITLFWKSHSSEKDACSYSCISRTICIICSSAWYSFFILIWSILCIVEPNEHPLTWSYQYHLFSREFSQTKMRFVPHKLKSVPIKMSSRTPWSIFVMLNIICKIVMTLSTLTMDVHFLCPLNTLTLCLLLVHRLIHGLHRLILQAHISRALIHWMIDSSPMRSLTPVLINHMSDLFLPIRFDADKRREEWEDGIRSYFMFLKTLWLVITL